MTETDLLQTLTRGEDSHHQFKRDATNADGMAAELAAFAKSGGGTVFLGVDDDCSIAGLDAADVRRLNQLISNAASQHVRPPLHPQTHNVQTAKGLVLVVLVPDGLNKPYMDLQGRVWVKSGADKRHVTVREEMQRMFQRGGLLQADRVPVRNATEAYIDERAFGCYFELGMAFIKRSLHKMQAGRGCKQIRTGVSNRRNQVLAEHAAHILPYRGMGTGVPRALYAWPQIDLVDKPEINQFRAAVVWRAVASTEATTPNITPEVAHEVGRLLQVLVGEMSRAHAARGDAP